MKGGRNSSLFLSEFQIVRDIVERVVAASCVLFIIESASPRLGSPAIRLDLSWQESVLAPVFNIFRFRGNRVATKMSYNGGLISTQGSYHGRQFPTPCRC